MGAGACGSRLGAHSAEGARRSVATNVVTILAAVFALIGAVLSVLAARRIAERRRFLRSSETSSGTVVALKEEPDGCDVTYRPRVVFRTAAGVEVTFDSEVSSRPASWRVGDVVGVRYARERPRRAEIDSFWSLWLPGLVLGLLGVVFLFVGVGILTGDVPV